MFTERFFKPKLKNKQNCADLKYHGETFCGNLAHPQSFIHSIPSVTNDLISSIFLKYSLKPIVPYSNEICMNYSVTCMTYLVTYGHFLKGSGLYSL